MAMTSGYQQSPEHVQRRVAARLATIASKPKPVTREWLEARYVGEGLDCAQIGAMLDRDPKTVWAWLRHYGIPTRPRGGATASGSFRAGQVSTFAGRRHTQATREHLRSIAKADGRLPYDPAVGPCSKGRRGAAATNWKGGVTPERQAFYGSDEWKQACKAVWARAGARCERCGRHHNTAKRRGTFQIHHIVSFAVRALRAEPTNLVLLCTPCHRFVHSKANTAREFIREAA